MFYYTMFRRTNKDVILCKLIENEPIYVTMEKEVQGTFHVLNSELSEKYMEMFSQMQMSGGEFKQVRKEVKCVDI